jgi:hypothetical protein
MKKAAGPYRQVTTNDLLGDFMNTLPDPLPGVEYPFTPSNTPPGPVALDWPPSGFDRSDLPADLTRLHPAGGRS